MNLLMAFLGMAAQPVLVTTREPRAPDVQALSLSGRCGGDTLEVSQFGTVRPSSQRPRIRVNGMEVRGVSDARTFLSSGSAVYRLALQCPQGAPGFLLRIYRAERARTGTMTYQVQTVTVSSDGSATVQRPDQMEPDSFWFR